MYELAKKYLTKTSLLFVIPSATSWILGIPMIAFTTGILACTSVVHHGFIPNESMWRCVDRIYASMLTLIMTTIALAYGEGPYSRMAGVCGLVAIALFLASKVQLLRNGRMELAVFLHGCLHVVGALGFVLLAVGAHRKELRFQPGRL